MFWSVISEREKSLLDFAPQAVEIDNEVYLEDILKGALKPGCNAAYYDDGTF